MTTAPATVEPPSSSIADGSAVPAALKSSTPFSRSSRPYGNTIASTSARTRPVRSAARGRGAPGPEPPDEDDEPEREDVEEVAVVEPVDRRSPGGTETSRRPR